VHPPLHAARLHPGDMIELPEAPFLHLFVPCGTVTLEDAGSLTTGDAVRLTATGGQKATSTEPAEILVWEMHAAGKSAAGRPAPCAWWRTVADGRRPSLAPS